MSELLKRLYNASGSETVHAELLEDAADHIEQLEAKVKTIAAETEAEDQKIINGLIAQLDAVREIVDTLPRFSLYDKLTAALNGERHE